MTKVVDYLEKIYDSGGASVYMYIVVGGVALILILLLLLSFINKKDKPILEDAEGEKEGKLEKKHKKNRKEELSSGELKEKPIILEQPKDEKDDFSSVYVDVPNKEPEIEFNTKEDKVIEKPIIEKSIENKVEPITEKPIEDKVIEAVSSSEILAPNMEIKPSVKEFEEPQILEDKSLVKEVFEKTEEEIAPKIEEVKVETNFSEQPLNTFDVKSDNKKENELPTLQTDALKEEPLVLEPNDIKSKLENISSKKESTDESSLDDLLKQMGVDTSPEITGNKDEEDILLGK